MSFDYHRILSIISNPTPTYLPEFSYVEDISFSLLRLLTVKRYNEVLLDQVATQDALRLYYRNLKAPNGMEYIPSEVEKSFAICFLIIAFWNPELFAQEVFIRNQLRTFSGKGYYDDVRSTYRRYLAALKLRPDYRSTGHLNDFMVKIVYVLGELRQRFRMKAVVEELLAVSLEPSRVAKWKEAGVAL